MNLNTILFICTGNIHRSPMAESIFRKLISDKGLLESWEIASAGTNTTPGETVPLIVRDTIGTDGLGLEFHRSQQIHSLLMESYALILVMESRHKTVLQTGFSKYADKVYLISEMVGKTIDVEDPIGGTKQDFKDTKEEISHYLATGINQIIGLSKSKPQNP